MSRTGPDGLNGIKEALRLFITGKFLPSAGVDAFEDDDSFLEKGILDSTGVLELLEYLEEKFKIRVEDEEIVPANLDSLTRLSSFVLKKTQHAGS
jgi:acyl carrier protein